ncbi:YdeI/OmpD-associated family protein [Teredinibacter turnerae]|uniref:YdeI/OmpD-associated family protein n=1 Tax=Teredinibacter turnerae TaxID=2426 RepID=UPI00036946B0|nr:DUF1801 domain-containing protein [Teredinibacter turnerae]
MFGNDIESYIAGRASWRAEIEKLRVILIKCGLDETIKWSKPCYVFQGRNIAIIQPFKNVCALMFFCGKFLDDVYGKLQSQGENSQLAMRLQYRCVTDIDANVIEEYVEQAKNYVPTKTEHKKRELVLPEELIAAFGKSETLEQSFFSLTLGRQRGFVLYISGAKKSATRAARVEKCESLILSGKGLHDK